MQKAFFAFLLVVCLGVFNCSPVDHGENHVAKRSLYTEKNLGLGMEKISKRSVKDEEMDTGESGVYFLPNFARRSKRSADEDMETGESGVYFLPSFSRRRSRRSIDDLETGESGVYFIPSFARRQRIKGY
ncbi:hypothetical protein GWI33_017618 [Rhynchophorus ferrugineus]|uniref:Uncharacterized protein n=1 Tax=Rhynchophorus ferrugineus TaxID=354439 RepID=A0A834I1N7_RHYFE|nr:hypothetical protein GWI33_017618 [Rhynchophorus ferrugineus]